MDEKSRHREALFTGGVGDEGAIGEEVFVSLIAKQQGVSHQKNPAGV
jgi:hypothetical protein